MVFKSFTHLARPSFTKALNHGYAQSVVAATQSSYASSTTPYPRSSKVGRPQTAQLHTSFQNASGQSTVSAKADINTTCVLERKDGDPNLQGYYEALWKRQQAGEEAKEWTQFQFAKRIEWNPPSVVPHGKGKKQGVSTSKEDGSPHRDSLDRAYSTSAIDEIKKVEDEATEATALAKVDEAVTQEINQIQQSSAAKDTFQQPAILTLQDATITLDGLGISSARSFTSSTPSSIENVGNASPRSTATVATSVEDTEAQAFSEYIAKLHEDGLYGQIPAVFESMVVHGLKPAAKDYNALLSSAIHLPVAKDQIVSKALDIFSDMLRRKVVPDTAFYAALIELFADHALDVYHMKGTLETERTRFEGLRGPNSFLLPSDEADHEILLQDDSLSKAVNIFKTSIATDQARKFSSETYQKLVTACALYHNIDDMITTFTHMESHKVKPNALMFPPMIKAFAGNGDLNNAVECYNGYKSLAVADNAGQTTIIDRNDTEIYTAVVRAYTMCGRRDGADRFLAKIIDSYANVNEQREEKIEILQNSVVLGAFVEDRLRAFDFSGAMNIVEERTLTPPTRNQAMARICVMAADFGDSDLATKAFQYLLPNEPLKSTAAVSMLALQLKEGNLDAARDVWTHHIRFDHSLVAPTTSYAVALVQNGHVEEGLVQARKAFESIRTSTITRNSKVSISEVIDEAIQIIGTVLLDSDTILLPSAGINLFRSMIENGGLVTPVAERTLARLGPMDIANMDWQDAILTLQTEAHLVGDSDFTLDVTHTSRFAHLLKIVVDSNLPLDGHTTGLLDKAMGKLSLDQPDLVKTWQNRPQASATQPYIQVPLTPQSNIVVSSPAPFADSHDPYAVTTDYKGSSIIAEELETRRNSAGLNEALIKFKNIRRIGRHPRYIVYAKLISAAAKEGRNNLIHDIVGMARADVPFLPQYPVVRHGWATILDSMVGACLTIGDRTLAERFHQEMLAMGTTPTANTFGLYITTLKESTRTFDEASEAVSIFRRAVSEGVVPSSFLYNALIGKLGKARRIDDCLRYFTEMQDAGIRPTSVTYGTVVNALCRVSHIRLAEDLFEEMESAPNYKPRPAPYNSLMQFFLTTKRDSQKVLSYYDRMQSRDIQATMHTYKLLIDTYATLEPINMAAAEGVLHTIRASGQRPEAVHYASLIHAKGCVLHDMEGARQTFDQALACGEIRPQACIYQALFESMVANHCVAETDHVLNGMSADRVGMTPYIANTLIHGWATENNVAKAKAIYDSVGMEKREPSTYEAMTRAFLAAQNRNAALSTVHEMLSRGYPTAVSGKILELVGHGMNRPSNFNLSDLIT